MPQHLSIRVPWHDHGWDGTVCKDPQNNNSCLRLKNIYENRDDNAEAIICGQCMAEHAPSLSCISEGSAFMSPVPMVRTTVHPYKTYGYATHQHFLPTDIIYPAYSFPARPFLWLMRDQVELKRRLYDIDFQQRREPILKKDTIWVQDAENHRAIFDSFYSDVVPEQSLCIAYAKQVPFVEDARRIVIGIGHVAQIVPAVEHRHTNDGSLRSMIWETMICHSIRPDHRDGFIIPYQQMMEYAKSHPDFDMASIVVFAPDDAFDEFSYVTEHVSYDSVIDVLQSCIKSFRIINSCLDEDYSDVLEWLNKQLEQAWRDRGAFPGMGTMLYAFGIQKGLLIAKAVQKLADSFEDVWSCLDEVISHPATYLEQGLAASISPIIRKTWQHLPEERKVLFRLLSRFSMTIDQATVLFNENERIKWEINCQDRDIIENPYIIYEQTRLKQDALFVSVKKVDRAVFPATFVLEKYPLAAPSALTSENDERRIRAAAVAVLENEAAAGNTILPIHLMVDRIRTLILEPACTVSSDILNAIDKFLQPEILRREMKDGTEYYKLVRLNEFDRVIESRISKRMRAAKKLAVHANWRKMLDEKFDHGEKQLMDPQSDEGRARQEKAAILAELAQSRISVLVGGAGTGKTTVLSVLCSHPDIKAGGVLLLAPTGKATVRLLDSMGREAENMTALNVAQFLSRCNRFDGKEMRYKLSDYDFCDVPETAIIDEASMLTEEMFGALMQALKAAKRIIFVGDPNQLPPIGAGRPFVDLVNLLRMNLKEGAFPRVCECYGELTINNRQRSEGIRLDVELSRLFTNTGNAKIEDVIAEINKGSNTISIITWSSKDDLEAKLLQTIADETGMAGTDDQDGFDLSLGGTKGDYGMFFNRGCAEYADRWQILAPVRNMPQGVLNINRLIHQKYREHYLEVSKRYGPRKRIPRAIGPESIVYGDKIINVANHKHDAYPKGSGRNYIANGEIGIACGSYSAKKPSDSLQIEFSSQKGFGYYFSESDFNEESGTAPLELAYALTVHKAQGSQFDTVILVISEPCLLLSRELLYTALTRQVGRIVILYNEQPYHLQKYASCEFSDIARRFTDLFADVFHEGAFDMRPQVVQVKNKFYEERLIHRTARGELVRSKSEVIIANALYYHHLEYIYEPELVLGEHTKYPDFKVVDDDTGEEWLWEHCGMMEDPRYRKRWEDKKAFYEKNGIEEGRNLIVTYDVNGAIDSHAVEAIIQEYFDV